MFSQPHKDNSLATILLTDRDRYT